MSIKLDRRQFMMTMAASASCVVAAPSLAGFNLNKGNVSESVIAAILKKRLPNITLDEANVQAYINDVMHRLGVASNQGGQAFVGIFKNAPSTRQLEQFIVQDFLVNSNALSAAQSGSVVHYNGDIT